VTSITNTTPTRTSISLQATSNVDGVFYWYVATEGTSKLPNNSEISFNNLKNLIGDYFNLDISGTSQEDQTESEETEVKPSEVDMQDTLQSWTSFARRIYKNHLMTGRYTGASISRGSVQVDFASLTNLFAETDYEVWVYVEDQQNVVSNLVTHTFSTQTLPEAAKFIATFEGDLNITNTVLREQIALTLGVQPTRLINELKTEKAQTNTTSKETKYEWDLPALRTFEGPTPTSKVTLLDWQITELRARIAQKDPKASVPTFTYQTIEFSSISTPAWSSGTLTLEDTDIIKSGSPLDNDILLTETSVQVHLICNTPGQICGVCLHSDFDNYPNHN